jgi:hypothetical protein
MAVPNKLHRKDLNAAPIQNVDAPYADLAAMFADQSTQEKGYLQKISGDTKLYLYLGTTVGDITDYYEVGGGGGGSDSVAYKEVPSGAVDGVNTVFTTVNTPLSIDFIWLFINGVARTGFTYDAGLKQVTLDFAPTAGSLVEIQYISSLGNPFPDVTVHNSLSGLNTGDFLHINPTEKANYETSYAHSQVAHAPADAQKNSDITKAEVEAALTGTISTHAHDLTGAMGVVELKDELKATAAATTTDVDWSQGIQFPIPMTSNTTLTFSNILQGKAIMLVVTGNYTLTLPTGVDPADLTGFIGTNTNYINIYCVDSVTPVFLTTLISK